MLKLIKRFFSKYKIYHIDYMGEEYYFSVVKKRKDYYFIKNNIPNLEEAVLTDDKVKLRIIKEDRNPDCSIFEKYIPGREKVITYLTKRPNSSIMEFGTKSKEYAEIKIENHKKITKRYNRIPKIKSVYSV